MKKLVVVADDFGLCRAVNEGIVEAYQQGIVTEMSLMLGLPGTDDAMDMVRKRKIENVGIHMLLKNWRDTGALVRRPDYVKLFEDLSEAEIRELVRVELEEFERVVGRKPSHITSQYQIITHMKAFPAVVEYAAINRIPVRLPTSKFDGERRELNQEAFESDLRGMKEGESAEMCLHPGWVDEELRSLTSLVEERERDTKLAMDEEFWTFLVEQG